jgi:hypothetical protein
MFQCGQGRAWLDTLTTYLQLHTTTVRHLQHTEQNKSENKTVRIRKAKDMKINTDTFPHPDYES